MKLHVLSILLIMMIMCSHAAMDEHYSHAVRVLCAIVMGISVFMFVGAIAKEP